MPERLILGVGHPHRGDDAAGLEVVRRLQARDLGPTRVAAVWGEATEILEAWRGFDSVTVVDATSGAGPAGAIVRLDADSVRLRAGELRASSHGLGVPEAVALARQLGRLPPHLVIYGIEGRRFGVGEAMSPEVEHAAAALALVLGESGRPLGAARGEGEALASREAEALGLDRARS